MTGGAVLAGILGGLGGSPAVSPAARAWLRGQAALQRGQLPEALQELRAAASRDLPPAWAWLALALAEQGAVDEAVEAADRALALDDRTPDVTGPVSLALSRAGRTGQATELALVTLRRDPSNQQATIAVLGQGAGVLDRALEAVEQARRRGGPPESEFLVELNLANLLEAAGRGGEAAAAFLRALRLAPGQFRGSELADRALESAARNEYRAGRFAEARALAEAVLSRDPEAVRTLATLGAIAIAEGGHGTAREHFRAALTRRPGRLSGGELAAALDLEAERTGSLVFAFYAAWVLREAGEHGAARERFLALRERSGTLPATLRDEVLQAVGGGPGRG